MKRKFENLIIFNGDDTSIPFKIQSTNTSLTRLQLESVNNVISDIALYQNGGANALFLQALNTGDVRINWENAAGDLHFSYFGSTRLTIKSYGHIGIGTTNPGSKVSLGPLRQFGVFTDINVASHILLHESNNSNTFFGFGVDDVYGLNIVATDGTYSGGIVFSTGTGTTATKRMFLTPSGFLGLNQLTPTAQLHIVSTNDSIGQYGIKWFNNSSSRGFTLDNDGSLLLNGRLSIVWANGSSFTALDITAQTAQIINIQGSGSGSVKIGTGVADSDTIFHIKGKDATSGNYALKVDNSSSSPLLYVRNDKFVSINGTSLGNGILEVTGGASQGIISTSSSIAINGVASGAGAIGVIAQNLSGAGTSLYIRSYDPSNVLIDIVNSSTSPISRMLDSGYFGIGTISPTAMIHIKGSDSTSSNYALKINNSSNASQFSVRNDGFVFQGDGSTNNYFWTNSVYGQIGITNEAGLQQWYTNITGPRMYFGTGGSGSGVFAHYTPSSGNWLFGETNTSVYSNTDATSKIWIQGKDATSANNALRITDGLGNALFTVRNDGEIFSSRYIRSLANNNNYIDFVADGGTNIYGINYAALVSPTQAKVYTAVDHYITLTNSGRLINLRGDEVDFYQSANAAGSVFNIKQIYSGSPGIYYTKSYLYSSLGRSFFGIGTTTTNTALDVVGDVSFRSNGFQVISANVNDYSTANQSLLKLNPSGNFDVTGFANGYDGKQLTIIAHKSGGDLTFKNEDIGSAASNRLYLGNSGANIIVRAGDAIHFVYDGDQQRWVNINY